MPSIKSYDSHLKHYITDESKTVYHLKENLFTTQAVLRGNYLFHSVDVKEDIEWLVNFTLDGLRLKFGSVPRVDQVIPLTKENVCQEVLASVARKHLSDEKKEKTRQRSTLVKRNYRYLVQREAFATTSIEEVRAGEYCLVVADSLCNDTPIEQMKEYLTSKGAFPLAICSLVERRPGVKNPAVYPSTYEELPVFSLEWLSQYSILKKSEKGLKGLIIDQSTTVF